MKNGDAESEGLEIDELIPYDEIRAGRICDTSIVGYGATPFCAVHTPDEGKC